MSTAVRVWDLPTRLFHWSTVACVGALFATGYAGGAATEWHARLGYALLALLMFRLAWGLVGGRWSRFSSFLYSPRRVLDYLRGDRDGDHSVGHNPLGALSVLAILVVLLLQVGTGLVSDDEIAFTGPLNRFVSSGWALAATGYHRQVGQWLVVGWTILHLAAVFFYLWGKKQNLIAPMVHGDKRLARAAAASRDDAWSRLAALLLLGVTSLLVLGLIRLGG